MSARDEDGQPDRIFNLSRRAVRSQDELIGICKGVVADKMLLNEEADFLINWFAANKDAANSWPGDVLLARLEAIYRDGVVTKAELNELRDLLFELTGVIKDMPAVPVNLTTGLPLDKSGEPVVIPGHSFCFTGKLFFGPRKEAEAIVKRHGGTVDGRVTAGLSYLVVGALSSRDWKHSTHGLKILNAVENQKKGSDTRIIDEEKFLNGVPDINN